MRVLVGDDRSRPLVDVFLLDGPGGRTIRPAADVALSERQGQRTRGRRRRGDNEVFTSSTLTGYKGRSSQVEDGAMFEFALGIGAALFVRRWVRSAGPALGIPAVTVTVLTVIL